MVGVKLFYRLVSKLARKGGVDMNRGRFENGFFLTLCVVGMFAILSSTMSKNPVLNPFAESLGTPEALMGFIAAAS
jgi:hypothetical protein